MTRPMPFHLLLFIALTLASPFPPFARDIPPFVSSDWLKQDLGIPGLAIVDIRNAADYKKGHIPKAVNVAMNSWTANKNGFLRELPSEKDLFELMGSIGIREDSKVVVVGAGINDFDRADAVRVAWTILIAGAKNVSVLDGGFPKWVKENRPISIEPPPVQSSQFMGKINISGLASKQYVLNKIGQSIILDNRIPEIFFGINTEPWALKPGHIKGSVNLPAPWVFSQEGFLRSQAELKSMVEGVVGQNKTKEIIAYCGVGVYSSVWSYILTELLGYKDVKVFDGSMQEWIMDPAGPIEIYRWH
jgi:thiosulfate/3-mercaptopyruvate sulfurtransferase